MDALKLTSARSDAAVEFSCVDGDDFRVSVTARDHSAMLDVCADTDRYGVLRLFVEAARDWTGWSGAKVWESLEGEFRLELSHDGLGHVALAVRLRHDFGGWDEWRQDAVVWLEAGQLERIARDARRLWNAGA